jgi:hypothetical protein
MYFVELRSFNNYIEANTVLKMLRSFRINCHLQDEPALTVDSLLNPVIGNTKLMVHPAHIETAWDLLDKAEEAYLKSIPCPICKAHALTTICITKKHKCKLAALASMLLNGHSVEITRLYQCKACGYDFKELPPKE